MAEETVECEKAVSVLMALTIAPATIAPELSVTLPAIAPRKVCAKNGDAKRYRKSATVRTRDVSLMFSPQVTRHVVI